jgi:hypothetical protein
MLHNLIICNIIVILLNRRLPKFLQSIYQQSTIIRYCIIPITVRNNNDYVITTIRILYYSLPWLNIRNILPKVIHVVIGSGYGGVSDFVRFTRYWWSAMETKRSGVIVPEMEFRCSWIFPLFIFSVSSRSRTV